MDLFRRKAKGRWTLPGDVAESLPGLEPVGVGETAAGKISVSLPEGSLDALIQDLVESAAVLYPTLNLDDTIALIFVVWAHSSITGADPWSLAHRDQITAQTMSRVGYASRVVETQRFQSAQPAWELGRILEEQHGPPPYWWDVISRMAGAQAAEEALAPGPDELGSLSWLVPGLGGHVRGAIADKWATFVPHQGDAESLSHNDLMRLWKFGFFVRAYEEVLPDGADLSAA